MEQHPINVFAAYTSALDEKTRQFMEEAMRSSQGQFPVQWLQTFIRRLAAKDMELQDRERQVTEYVKAMNYSYSASYQSANSQRQQHPRYASQHSQYTSQHPQHTSQHDTQRYRPYEQRTYRGSGRRGGDDRGRRGTTGDERGRNSVGHRGRSTNKSYYRSERTDGRVFTGDTSERQERHDEEVCDDEKHVQKPEETFTSEYDEQRLDSKQEKDPRKDYHQCKDENPSVRQEEYDEQSDHNDLEDGEY